ncbi:uncharacterized protein BX663DRAFT_576686 [Cokeromyces recurvatus]|uniref:uncharacterized protein n=1 Tax=Cokeromyces recurvatus TaxID=90255 RepID=UPI00221F2F12|nr:uncharacterized protein BX663DRAFT_576686 [Cokeromyces recurvatus]KAI7899766.1 hypothetical protein BX663DRAFT_576686 [Cokeromyces recurvatus]
MDSDYMFSYHNKQQYQRFSQQPRHSQQKQLRAYNKHGSPICDYCCDKHRTMDHNKRKRTQFHNSNKQSSHGHQRQNKHTPHIREMQSQPQVQDQQQISSSFSVDISHFATDLRKLPRSPVASNHNPISLLWDTGADINGIQRQLFDTMNAVLDVTERAPYRDVNNQIKTTCGMAVTPILG